MYDVCSRSPDPRHLPVSWDNLNKLHSCAVIADDLMDVSDENFTKLQELLNYSARHNSISPVLLLTHCVTRNNIFSLLKHIGEFWVTLNKQNVETLYTICQALKFPRASKESFASRFLAEPGQYGMFVLNAQKRTFERMPEGKEEGGAVDGGEVKPERDLEPFRRKAEEYLPHFFHDPARTMVIFNYLLAKIPLGSLSHEDLVFTLKRKESGLELRISLLDYLHAVTTDTKPSGEILSLHKYIKKHVELPMCMLRNRYLQKA